MNHAARTTGHRLVMAALLDGNIMNGLIYQSVLRGKVGGMQSPPLQQRSQAVNMNQPVKPNRIRYGHPLLL